MTQPLSPAAQAVLDAFGVHPIHSDHIASDLLHGALPAALRAVADQVVPHEEWLDTDETCFAHYSERKRKRAEILAIAAELEGGR